MEQQIIQTDWCAILTIIGSILVPMLAGFGWVINKFDRRFDQVDQRLTAVETRVGAVETRVAVLETRIGFIERLLEMIGVPLKSNKERTDP